MENIKGKKGKTKHFRWSKLMEHGLLEILADEALKGNKPSNTFHPTSFVQVAKAITEKFGVTCMPEHVENHLRTIKNAWNIIQTLRNKSGFGWDENMKMITADKNVYDEEVMAHPAYEKYLNKKIEMYDEIAMVVGKDIATGCFSKQLGDIDTDVASPIEIDNDLEEPKRAENDKGKDSSVAPKKRQHRKRKSRDDEDVYLKISEQMSEMAKAMKALSQDQEQTRICSLYDVIMAIEGYDEVALANAFDYLVEHANVGRAFMVKSDALRKIWLDNFINHGGR